MLRDGSHFGVPVGGESMSLWEFNVATPQGAKQANLESGEAVVGKVVQELIDRGVAKGEAKGLA